jgi:hypothetical protein
MAKVNVVYKGPSDAEESGDYFQDTEDGTVYVLYRDVPTAVPGELADRLADYEGHEFQIGSDSTVTVPELKDQLDELDIKYPADAKKAELQSILAEQGASA